MRLASAEAAVGSEVTERLATQPQIMADVPSGLGRVAEFRVVLARPVGQRLFRDQVQQAFENARPLGEQELGLGDAGLVVNALLVFDVAADIDAETGNLTQVGDTFDGERIKFLRLARMLLEFGQHPQAEAIVQAAREFHHRGLLPVQRTPGQPPGAQLQLGDAFLDVRAVDFVGKPGLSRRHTAAPQSRDSHRREAPPTTHTNTP